MIAYAYASAWHITVCKLCANERYYFGQKGLFEGNALSCVVSALIQKSFWKRQMGAILPHGAQKMETQRYHARTG